MNLYYGDGFKFICVDPGVRGCGFAQFEAGVLKHAAYIKNPTESGRGYDVYAKMAFAIGDRCLGSYQSLIIELPRIYGGSSQQKGDPNDLLDVAGVGAAISAHLFTVVSKVESVLPQEWKGQVPKEVMTGRISRAITNEERNCIEKCYSSLTHNVLDAIGIGLWKLNRINARSILND